MFFLQCFGVVVFRNNTYVNIVIEYSRNSFTVPCIAQFIEKLMFYIYKHIKIQNRKLKYALKHIFYEEEH